MNECTNTLINGWTDKKEKRRWREKEKEKERERGTNMCRHSFSHAIMFFV